MKTTETLLISYSGTVFATITILSLLNIAQVEVYAALFAIEFFILSELIPPTGLTISRRRMVVGVILIAVFVGMMFGRIIEVIMQT